MVGRVQGEVVDGRAGRLVERTGELKRLAELIDSVTGGVGSAVVVEGVPGLGKTRVLAEAVELARVRGIRVLRASATRGAKDLPGGVVLRLVEPYLARLGEDDRSAILGGAAALTLPLLTGNTEHPGSASSPSAILHGLFWLMVNIAAGEPLLVCVDDLQWCDDTTTRLLLRLVERIEDLPIALLMAARPRAQGVESEPLRELRSITAISVLHLEPLSRLGVIELLGAQRDSVDDELGAACWEATDGNPFYVRQLLVALDNLHATGSPTDATRVRALGSAATARAGILRLVRCPQACVRLAESLAVLDGPTSLQLVAELSELTQQQAAEAADELAVEDLIVPGASLEFVHPLIRQAIYDEIPPAARALKHAAAARLLRDSGARIEAVAAQLMHAPVCGDQDVVETLRHAARQALDLGSAASAARMLHRALAERPGEHRTSDLLVEIAGAETRAGMSGAVEHARAGLDRMVEPGDRATAYRVLARALDGQNRPGDAVEALDMALGEFSGNSARPPVDVLVDYLAYATFLPVWRQRAYARVEPLLCGDFDATNADDRLMLAMLALRSGQTGAPQSQTRELAERAWHGGALLQAGPDSSGWVLAVSALELAQIHDLSRQICNAVLTAATRSGSSQAFIMASYYRGYGSACVGMLDEAQADAEQAFSARDGSEVRYVGSAMVLRALVLIERGRAQEAAASLDEAEVLPLIGLPGPPWRLHARGVLALASRRAAEALDYFEQAGRYLRSELSAEVTVLPWRTDAALAALQVGRRERALELVEEELAIAARAQLPISRGRALRLQGQIVSGEQGLDTLAEAVDVLDGTGAELERARALAELGAALRRSGRVRDARAPLQRSLDLALSLDAQWLAGTVGEELSAAGFRASLRRGGGPQLTPSQRRVAKLAIDGMTNSEIGQALFVTPKTVEYHLRQVYQRLQISGRRELRVALALAND